MLTNAVPRCAVLRLGCVACRSGNAAEAVECYTLCIALDPSQLAAYTNRAQAYLRLKRWDDAISDANSALDRIDAALQEQQEGGGSKGAAGAGTCDVGEGWGGVHVALREAAEGRAFQGAVLLLLSVCCFTERASSQGSQL